MPGCYLLSTLIKGLALEMHCVEKKQKKTTTNEREADFKVHWKSQPSSGLQPTGSLCFRISHSCFVSMRWYIAVTQR